MINSLCLDSIQLRHKATHHGEIMSSAHSTYMVGIATPGPLSSHRRHDPMRLHRTWQAPRCYRRQSTWPGSLSRALTGRLSSVCGRSGSSRLVVCCLPQLRALVRLVKVRSCRSVIDVQHGNKRVRTHTASWRNRFTLCIVTSAVGEEDIMIIGYWLPTPQNYF